MARTLFTSESVTEGHPDKMADQISDSILDAILADDPVGRVACETLVTTGQVVIAGEISTSTYVDIPSVVRQTVLDIGYDTAAIGFDGRTCGVSVSLDEQSPDIAMGVDEALEHRGTSTEDRYATLGAGDQGMMFGFACRETDVMMPLTIHLAHRMAERIADARRKGELEWLRPDAKTQVTAVYEDGRPVAIDTVVCSTQHDPDVTLEDVRVAVEEHVIRPMLPDDVDTSDVRIIVNPTGRFVSGGPVADAGLTGRKIIAGTSDPGVAPASEDARTTPESL